MLQIIKNKIILPSVDFFVKLFNTSVMATVKCCQDQFGFELPSVFIVKRKDKFLARYKQFELDRSCFILCIHF